MVAFGEFCYPGHRRVALGTLEGVLLSKVRVVLGSPTLGKHHNRCNIQTLVRF